MRVRKRNLVVRVDDAELEMMRALSHAADLSASQLLRSWIKQHFVARFGEPLPETLTRRGSR